MTMCILFRRNMCVLLSVLFLLSGCGDDDDDDDITNNDGDEDADDDAHDDDAVDDDTWDHDDDADDDDADDDADDDSDDDMDDDMDDDLDDDTFTTPSGIDYALIEGGAPGLQQTSVARTPDGAFHIAATYAGDLRVYSVAGTAVSFREVAADAALPELAADGAGNLHLLYFDLRTAELVYSTDTPGTWTRRTLDRLNAYYPQFFLAVDGAGDAHALYARGAIGARELVYATNRGGAWNRTVLDTGNIRDFVITTDASNHVHIVYGKLGSSLFTLIHATDETGSFTLDVIDNGFSIYQGGMGYSYQTPALAIDAQGRPNVMYIVVYNYMLGTESWITHAVRNGASWTKTTPSPSCYGYPGRLVINSQNHAFVAGYHRSSSYETSHSLCYATNESGTWQSTTLDADGGLSLDLTLDGDAPVISHQDDRRMNLKLARRSGTTWDFLVVDDAGDSGWFPQTVVRPDGSLHILHLSYGHNALRYTNNAAGPWQSVNPADAYLNDFDLGWYEISGDIDSQGSVHACVYDGHSGTLRYTTNRTGTWTTQLLESDWEPTYCQVKVDVQDIIHLAYLKEIDYSGEFAVIHGTYNGSWTFEEALPPTTAAGGALSMDLDAGDNPHLSFIMPMSADAFKLVHASNSGGMWSFEDVAFDVGDYDFESVIRLDNDDSIHIALASEWVGSAQLIHATDETGAWVSEILDTGEHLYPYAISEVSLATVAGGDVFLAYRWVEDGLDALKIAARRSGTWSTFFVDRCLFQPVGFTPNAFVEGEGRIGVAYYNDHALWLAKFDADIAAP